MFRRQISNMKTIKGVIFDLDGVLVSTDEQNYRAWKKVADDCQAPFDRETNNRLRGISRQDCIDVVLEKSTREYSDDEKEILCAKKNEYYLASLTCLSENIIDESERDMLIKLKSKGLRLAVASGSRNCRIVMEKTNLIPYFDAIVDGTMIKNGKPNPEVFLLAAKMIGLEASKCLIVEDAAVCFPYFEPLGFTGVSIGDAKRKGAGSYRLDKITDLSSLFE